MTTVTTTVLAACLALGSVSVIAQTAAPPTSGGSTGPTAPNPQTPAVSSKDGKPLGDHPALGKDEKSKGTAAMAPEPTGKDSMAKDNMPKHPAADGKKTPDPK